MPYRFGRLGPSSRTSSAACCLSRARRPGPTAQASTAWSLTPDPWRSPIGLLRPVPPRARDCAGRSDGSSVIRPATFGAGYVEDVGSGKIAPISRRLRGAADRSYWRSDRQRSLESLTQPTPEASGSLTFYGRPPRTISDPAVRRKTILRNPNRLVGHSRRLPPVVRLQLVGHPGAWPLVRLDKPLAGFARRPPASAAPASGTAWDQRQAEVRHVVDL